MLRIRSHHFKSGPARPGRGAIDATQPGALFRARGRARSHEWEAAGPGGRPTALTRIAHEIVERDKGAGGLALVGIAKPR
jgi:hypothetical protein